jgi:hypothetical protein
VRAVTFSLIAAFVAACARQPPLTPATSKKSDTPLDQARSTLSPEARIAFERLLHATQFESDRIGDGGELSENAAAVRKLIRDPSAPQAFQALFDRGSVVSRLYALTAFWYLRPTAFLKLVDLVDSTDGRTRVTTQTGCIIGEDQVSKVLRTSGANAVRLKPGAGLYDFMCGRRPSSYHADFVGGAVPIEIVEGTEIMDKDCKTPPPRPWYLKPR